MKKTSNKMTYSEMLGFLEQIIKNMEDVVPVLESLLLRTDTIYIPIEKHKGVRVTAELETLDAGRYYAVIAITRYYAALYTINNVLID